MIPKIIHYCWFGGNPLPQDAQQFIKSWKKHLPDYKIIEWNEENFDINCNQYCKEAYEAKKYAFVSDLARLHALCNYGGIYFDTDVEVLKSLDDLLIHKAFGGFENINSIGTAVIGCEKGFNLFEEFLDVYKDKKFLNDDGTYDNTANVVYLTQICEKNGFKANNQKQNVNGFMIYPKEYFSPKDYDVDKIITTPNSYTIHHFAYSWFSKEEAKRHKKAVFFRNAFGRKFGEILFLITEIPCKLKEFGFLGLINRLVKR